MSVITPSKWQMEKFNLAVFPLLGIVEVPIVTLIDDLMESGL